MAKYLLDFSRDAGKFLELLPPKQYKQVGKKVISSSKDPVPNDSILMQGYSHRHRVDIGEYRIIYEISENNSKIINILVIDKRNDDAAYNKAKRK